MNLFHNKHYHHHLLQFLSLPCDFGKHMQHPPVPASKSMAKVTHDRQWPGPTHSHF